MIKLDKVEYHNQNSIILKEVNLQLATGQFIGIIGPNGAGKSTLLRIIAGLIAPSRGVVSIDEQEISRLLPRERAKVLAFMPQHTALDFNFRCWDVVMMGRNPHLDFFAQETAQDVAIVQQAMEKTGTIQFRDRLFTQLSGGERQLVILARSLAQQPRYLLLDEPTSSLDIAHQLDIFTQLKQLSQQGVTVMAALHDMNHAARFCDQLVLLTGGQIISAGPVEQVLTAANIKAAFGIEAWIGTNEIIQCQQIVPLKRL